MSGHGPGLPVPRRLGDVTPAWLTAALRDGGALPEGEVESVAASVIGQDLGFTGVVGRLEATYRPPGAGPPSIVAKLPLAERAVASGYSRRVTAERGARRELFERSALEVRFYTEVARAGPAPAPELLYGAVDRRHGRVILLLAEVRDARQADLLGGISPDEAAAVLRAMARIHARWWDRAADIDWMPYWGAEPRARQERYGRAANSFLERHAPALPVEAAAVVENLRTRYRDVLQELVGAPRTIIHGDLHADNVLLVLRSVGPPEAVVLDWQTVALGPPAVDLNLLIVGSMRAEARRSHEERLISEYHAALQREGVHGIALEQLVASYRLATMWHLAATVGWLATADMAVLAGRERLMVEQLISEPRVFQAAIDHSH